MSVSLIFTLYIFKVKSHHFPPLHFLFASLFPLTYLDSCLTWHPIAFTSCKLYANSHYAVMAWYRVGEINCSFRFSLFGSFLNILLWLEEQQRQQKKEGMDGCIQTCKEARKARQGAWKAHKFCKVTNVGVLRRQM